MLFGTQVCVVCCIGVSYLVHQCVLFGTSVCVVCITNIILFCSLVYVVWYISVLFGTLVCVWYISVLFGT